MSRAVDRVAPSGRASTGIPGLDPLLDGGFPANRAILLCGGTGTGKTTVGLQFLAAGLQRGESGAFVSLDEKPQHVIEDARRLGLPLDDALTAGTLAMLDASPFFTASRGKNWTKPGVDARQVAADLVHQMRRVSAQRLVIDSITSLVPPEMERSHANDYLRSLVQSLEDNLGSTIIMTCRGSRLDPQGSCEAARYLSAGVLELRLDRHTLARTLRILKMRGTAVEPADYRIALDAGTGVSIAGPVDAADTRLFVPRATPLGAGARQPSDRPATV